MAENKTQRKLTAILSADVKGYSKLMGDDDESTVDTITAYRKIIAEFIQKHQGVWLTHRVIAFWLNSAVP